jgi:adenine-specific DNA-methyltransferase
VLPRSLAGPGEAHELDAADAAGLLDGDLAYLDPPYNQHKYLGNYHIWETLVRWDLPEVYGVACKRLDVRTRPSAFNGRRAIHAALAEVVARIRCPVLLVSFNNEGHLTREELEALLATRGRVTVMEHAFRRYVGATIGIYNPRGEKVGRVSHTENKELLYLVTP